MSQTQSIMRWIGQKHIGKAGEKLYPGLDDPETSYKIDTLLEYSEDWQSKFRPIYLESENMDASAKEFIENEWPFFVAKIDDILNKKENKNYLVGDCLTIADIALGSYFMRFFLNERHPHQSMYSE